MKSSPSLSFLNYAENAVAWQRSARPVPYEAAVEAMETRVEAIHAGTAGELIWLLEHPPLYTAGTSTKPDDLRAAGRFPVFKTKRGGQFTYHGPGQRVIYVMLDLRQRTQDVRRFVADLEAWIIDTLGEFGVTGMIRPGRVGVWVDRSRPGYVREDKIAAIGVRLKRWVSFHGISLNVEPELSHFDGIVPCGIDDPCFGVTSLVDLGLPVTMDDVDAALAETFSRRFGPVLSVQES